MKRHLAVPGMVLAFLVVMDLGVAALLGMAEDHGALMSLQRYFNYGLSVPGKLDRWMDKPDLPENLFDVAWIPDTVARSEQVFSAETGTGILRGYGMSFLADILKAAARQDPALEIDLHGGPGAPPNFAYALFLKDRPNRRPGDVVVLAILSSSLPAMAAMTNRSWAFEQPAPATYPVFWPDGQGGLRAVEPLVTSAAEERQMRQDPMAQTAWLKQLSQEDAFYAPITFEFRALDHSPLLRLLRRSWAMRTIDARKADIIEGDAGYPLAASLQTMISEFARLAREDGQIPVVILIQGRDPADADVLDMAQPVLDADDIPYLATRELANPSDLRHYMPDGHFTKAANETLAAAFRQLLPATGWARPQMQSEHRQDIRRVSGRSPARTDNP